MPIGPPPLRGQPSIQADPDRSARGVFLAADEYLDIRQQRTLLSDVEAS
jgi:hypothetical protein